MAYENQLRIAAQIALLGEVPATLRSVSITTQEKTLIFRAILQDGASEDDRESLTCVATEILASLPSDLMVEEDIIRFDGSIQGRELPLVVFRRKEAP